jgi:hypothetical protein
MIHVPKRAPSLRQQIHTQFCPDHEACRFAGGQGTHRQCDQLDALISLNDEWVLHMKARELLAEGDRLSKSTKRVAQAVVMARYAAAELVDPFEKVEAFDGDDTEHYHPGELNPGCPGCVRGVEHYHRKADKTPVRASIPPLPEESDTPSPRFRRELNHLLAAYKVGNLDGKSLRRIAELTELFGDEEQSRLWWDKAAEAGDEVAKMMVEDGKGAGGQ